MSRSGARVEERREAVREAGSPPRRMSVPRPAMFVAMVTAHGRPRE